MQFYIDSHCVPCYNLVIKEPEFICKRLLTAQNQAKKVIYKDF